MSQAKRAYRSAFLSFLANVLFAFYNLVLGVFYRLVWNFTISFYYLLLTGVKAVILFLEKKWKGKSLALVEPKRARLFEILSLFLIALDLSLIAPVILLLSFQKSVNVGQIPAIALAAYTTYQITIAALRYTKRKKLNNLSLEGLRIIRLKESIVSIITLQNTLIFTFGNASEMLPLTACTSIGLLAGIVALSVLQLITLKKSG